MAQLDAREKLHHHVVNPQIQIDDSTSSSSSSSCVPFKFNAQAPEFVPRSQSHIPFSGYVCPYFPSSLGVGTSCGTNVLGSADWFYIPDHDQIQLFTNTNVVLPTNCSKKLVTEDLQKKIVKQAEYQFCDMSLLANDSLMKHMSKDPEGYVPISIVANSKKMKSLVSNNVHILAQALRASSKLVVSSDGKKVRRKHMFAERDKEELQCRTVVAENLPEDHSHQNLEKIFNVVGSVKSIRICHPQESNSARSKGDCIISNKLHALVEYATADIADKAVETLTDERNWRKGLRVRALHRRSPKSVLKSRKSDFDGYLEEEEPESSEDGSHQSNLASPVDSNVEESSGGSKKGWGRIRGKTKGRSPSHGARGLPAPSPQSSSINNGQCETPLKQLSKGPRMPDGTRGFSMGRGKPIVV